MRTKRINSQNICNGARRIDGKFFLNEDSLHSAVLEDNKNRCVPLSQVAEVFNPSIFKRQFCQNTERAVMYFQSSDVSALSEYSSVFINKKQAESLRTLVSENQILVTGFGTIGNVRLASKLQDGACYANNVCRITTKSPNLYGFIYAFMASKYAKAQLNKNASGSVVRFIEAPSIKHTLVPIFPESKQQEIHNLIVESANLRVEANRLLEEAQNKIISMLNIDNKVEIRKVSIKNILTSHQQRFESHYYKSIGSIYRDKILQLNHILLNDASERIFRPGIFKRNYVKDGIDFLGGSDITKHIPNSEKKLSKKQTSNFDELTLKEDWILVTCGGTIGTSVLVNSYLANKLASQHILRVIPKGLKSGYLFAFLSSEIGLKVIQSFTYGSVIPQIEPHHLELVPIPLFANEIMDKIHLSVMKYKCNLNEAIIKENQAISLIEKEIELWQQS